MKYKFSVIMPVYNVEKYLEEAIKSIINQSIGFEENIQLILVNDGSTDNSEKICIKYRDEYPENIVYIKQENKGVSSARNTGMMYIEGEYVNIFDSDDKWNYDAFDIAYDFFEEHKNEIAVVSCREKFFEGKQGYHPLDYKFENGNSIIDITENYDYIQLSTATTFIKTEVLKKYKYDTKLKYSEDAVLISQILMENPKYGILAEAEYNYRKRKDKTSALQLRDKKKSMYFDMNELNSYEELMNKSKKIYGQILPYIQYLIMYNLQWKIKKDISLYLEDNEKENYIKKLKKLLKKIDDGIIMEQKSMWSEYKIITLSLKHNEDIREKLKYKDGKLYFNDVQVYRLQSRQAIKIEKIKLNLKSVTFTGTITYYLPKEDYKLYINVNDENYIINKFKIYKKEKSILRELNHYRRFRIKVPIKSKKVKIKFVLDYKGNKNDLCQRFDENAKFQIKKNKVLIKNLCLTLEADKNKIVVKKK